MVVMLTRCSREAGPSNKLAGTPNALVVRPDRPGVDGGDDVAGIDPHNMPDVRRLESAIDDEPLDRTRRHTERVGDFGDREHLVLKQGQRHLLLGLETTRPASSPRHALTHADTGCRDKQNKTRKQRRSATMPAL